jgi:hypothetical protein
MDVIDLPLEQIIPYARNPRRNEQAIATVAASIQEFGWRQTIVVDEAMVVLAGHTRLVDRRRRREMGDVWESLDAARRAAPLLHPPASGARLALRLALGLGGYATLLWLHPWPFGVSPLP